MNDRLGVTPRARSYLSDPEQPRREEPPRLRYLLCSTPRCGSTLIAEYLRSSGVAGDPKEYFNPRLMREYAAASEAGAPRGIGAFVRDMERRRTTPNGVFGMKAHFMQVLPFFEKHREAMVGLLRGYERAFLLRRRDKIAQAVSYARAARTGQWASDTAAQGEAAEMPFDPVDLTKRLANIVQQEEAWADALRRLAIPFEVIDYEDTLADGKGQRDRVLRALGIEITPDLPQPSSRFERQGRDDDPVVERFRQYLGANGLRDSPVSAGTR